jgi:putative NADH-flavin reductase
LRRFYCSVTVVEDHDAVLSAIGTSGSSIEVIVDAARSLIEGLSQVGIRRLVVVDGAGVLEMKLRVQFVDSPIFMSRIVLLPLLIALHTISTRLLT